MGEEDALPVKATEEVKEETTPEKAPAGFKNCFNLHPVVIIILCGLVGAAVGIGLSDGRGDPELVSWIKLPGDLFLRALKAIVLPLVFVNIILAVVDMISAGRASSTGGKTIGLYFLTTLAAAFEGLVAILIFRPLFSEVPKDPPAATFINLECPDGSVLISDDGVFCGDADSEDNRTQFFLSDPNGVLVASAGSGPANDISLSQTLQDGIFRKLVSDNIFLSFTSANFVAVVMFSIIFGVSSQYLTNKPKVVFRLLEEINRVLLKIIDWIIFITPIAILSLIAGNIGEKENLEESLADIAILIAATLIAMAFHFFVTYPLLFFVTVRANPFAYYKFLIPAQLFAFASASSAATLPLSLESVMSSKQVPASVANFVLSMGATLNMDGGGIYFPTAIVFLAVSSGIGDQLDAAAYFMIILLSTIGSAGTAPVPSASLVLIITAYNTVFNTTGTPDAFGLILAVDWLMDRFRTTLNVTGDMTMARVVTAVTGAKFEDDVLENEAVQGEDL